MREYLEQEAQSHGATRRRYGRVTGAMPYTAVESNGIAGCCGGAAVATLTARITTPVFLVLAALSLGAGGIATVYTLTGKMLGKYITKNGRIENTARVSQTTISAVVSKALIDQISLTTSTPPFSDRRISTGSINSSTRLRNTKMLTRQNTTKSAPKFTRKSTSCWLEDHVRMCAL